jgi:uncharacterized protein YaaN involved in tellurite resistance
MILNDDVYEALLRYADNTEPLIKILASKEIKKANDELVASKKSISTRMLHKSRRRDRLYRHSYKQFETKINKILVDFKSRADTFNNLMNTDA